MNREQFANTLTALVKTYNKGFVLAIDNQWGEGKTTFIKMWEQQLKSDNFRTIYFNAWENDFENNPLIALTGEFKDLVGNDDKAYKSITKVGATLLNSMIPAITKGLVDKYIGDDTPC